MLKPIMVGHVIMKSPPVVHGSVARSAPLSPHDSKPRSASRMEAPRKLGRKRRFRIRKCRFGFFSRFLKIWKRCTEAPKRASYDASGVRSVALRRRKCTLPEKLPEKHLENRFFSFFFFFLNFR